MEVRRAGKWVVEEVEEKQLNQTYGRNASGPFKTLCPRTLRLGRDSICLVEWIMFSLSVASDSLQPHGLYNPWNSPGWNTGMGSLSFLQGIFPIQGSNPSFPHCRQILYQLSHKGSPRMLELVAYPFSRGSSRPRNRTEVSCIAGRFFTD